MARRSTKCDEDVADIKETLGMIMTKLDTIGNSLQELVKINRDVGSHRENIYEHVQEVIATVKENFTSIPRYEQKDQLTIEREVSEKKKFLLKEWKKLLNKRKQLFWNHTNCENTANIYETWLSSEQPTLPKKFLLQYIPGEQPEEREVRKRVAISNFRAEIELLKMRARRHMQKLIIVEAEMETYLNFKCHGDTLNHLILSWRQDVDKEEKSQRIVGNQKKNGCWNMKRNFKTSTTRT